jgi:hypothetical protein
MREFDFDYVKCRMKAMRVAVYLEPAEASDGGAPSETGQAAKQGARSGKNSMIIE